MDSNRGNEQIVFEETNRSNRHDPRMGFVKKIDEPESYDPRFAFDGTIPKNGAKTDSLAGKERCAGSPIRTGMIAGRSMAIGLVVVAAWWTTPSVAVVLTTTQQIAHSGPKVVTCKECQETTFEHECRCFDEEQKKQPKKKKGKRTKTVAAQEAQVEQKASQMAPQKKHVRFSNKNEVNFFEKYDHQNVQPLIYNVKECWLCGQEYDPTDENKCCQRCGSHLDNQK